jgi:predicted double-glycine peptidase
MVRLLFAALVVVAAGCATGEVSLPRHRLERFPDVIQSNNYSCGVACVQAVLQYHGIWGYQDDYAKALGTTEKDGTHPARMVAYLKARGLDARLQEGLTVEDLERFVDEGTAVIVDYQAWNDEPKKVDYANDWEDGHYSVVVGYDADRLFLEDPVLLGSTGWLAIPDFERRWRDYETEDNKRREYRRSGIVVQGARKPLPEVSPID